MILKTKLEKSESFWPILIQAGEQHIKKIIKYSLLFRKKSK